MLCFELEVLISESAYVHLCCRSFALLPCFSVHFTFFCVLTPCSPVGGYNSLSSLISHTAVAAVSGLVECFAVATGK